MQRRRGKIPGRGNRINPEGNMVQGRKPNLKRRRLMANLRAQGLTFKEIGKRLGVSRQCVHRLLFPPPKRRTAPCSGCGVRGGLPRTGGSVLCLACLRETSITTLAQRLKALRLAAGMNRASLARQASLCHVTIWKLEKGHCWPHRTTFERLAQALGVTVAVLTGEEPLPRSKERKSKGAIVDAP